MQIPARFNGPPGSANGGIAAGLLAGHLDPAGAAAEVTLHRPPPLDRELQVTAGRLLDGELLVAEARLARIDPDLEVPPALLRGTVRAAAASYAGLVDHPFPGCYVCGTQRADGMGLQSGRVGPGQVAAEWTPADDDPVMVWGALDCPGGWSADVPGRPVVLGRTTLRLDELPVAGEPHHVQGWLRGTAGRKVLTGTSLRTAGGRLLAVAQSTWLTIPTG